MEKLDQKLIHLLIVLPNPGFSYVDLFSKLTHYTGLMGEPGFTSYFPIRILISFFTIPEK